MGRRSFLKRAGIGAAAASLAALPTVKVPTEGKWGAVGVDYPSRYSEFRAFLNGEEITSLCRNANDQEGWAEVYTEGHLSLKRVYGDVRLVHKDEA